MSISKMLLPEYDAEMANTRKMLERVPDDKFEYQPHPKSMTLGRLASHVAEMPSWAGHTMKTELLEIDKDHKGFSASTRQELLDTFDKAVLEGHQAIADASDEDFQKLWTMKFDGKQIMSMPRIAVLRGMVMNHMIHHRAQLGVFLRLNDIAIPGMYGPSADEAQFWKAESA